MLDVLSLLLLLLLLEYIGDNAQLQLWRQEHYTQVLRRHIFHLNGVDMQIKTKTRYFNAPYSQRASGSENPHLLPLSSCFNRLNVGLKLIANLRKLKV